MVHLPRCQQLRRLLLRVGVATTMSGPVLGAQSRRDVAMSVMANARSLCFSAEQGEEVTVRCTSDLPQTNRLAFATAIANADAVLSGRARHLVFRIRGGSAFAEASPKIEIHALSDAPKPTAPQGAPRAGRMATDTVLALHGKALSSTRTGKDERGLVVDWRFADATYTMARRAQDGIDAYRVVKIVTRKATRACTWDL